MSESPSVSIAELAEVNPKVDLRGLREETLVSFIPMSDVTEDGQWRNRQESRLTDVRAGYTPFAENDVLFAKITPCMENGKGAHAVGLKNRVGFGSTEFHVLRARNQTSPRFLFHWLQAKTTRTRAIAYMGGSAGQQRVQRDFFTNYRIPDLAPPDQSRIAAVLDIIDDAIAKTEAVIAKLRQVRAGLIHDLLTRGLDQHGQLRDPVAHPEQFQETTLGRFPLDWAMPSLAQLCSHIGSGATPRGGQDVYTKSGILFIRSQNVTFSGLLLDDVAYIPAETHLGMSRSEIFAHDVLFNITGASIGRCCPMPTGLGPANVNQHVCALRVPSAAAADAKYLATLLASPIGQRQMDSLLTVGNRQGLNYMQLGSLVIPWPAPDEREGISSQIQVVEDRISAGVAERTKLSELKSGLMKDLLSGNVRVPENTTL